MSKSPIRFQIRDGDRLHDITTYTYKYRNLMLLISDKIFVENFGECGGMGRCATCLVALADAQLHPPLEGSDRNEYNTLHKAGIDDEHIRLSCQLLITPQLEGRTFVLMPQEY